jgi:hypothetical protein
MTPRLDSLVLIVFLSISVPCKAQDHFRRYRVTNIYRRSRRGDGDEFFLGLPSFSPCLNFQNQKLDNYLISRGGRPVKGLGSGNFFRTLGNFGNHFELGGYYGYTTDYYFDSFRGFNVGLSAGWRIFYSGSFSTSVIGEVGSYNLNIYGLQPTAVAPGILGHLTLSAACYGLNSISYIKLASWYNRTECSLNLGVEMGVVWVASNTWYFGEQNQKGGVSVKVPDVPSFGSPYEYLRFSLAFKF